MNYGVCYYCVGYAMSHCLAYNPGTINLVCIRAQVFDELIDRRLKVYSSSLLAHPITQWIVNLHTHGHFGQPFLRLTVSYLNEWVHLKRALPAPYSLLSSVQQPGTRWVIYILRILLSFSAMPLCPSAGTTWSVA